MRVLCAIFLGALALPLVAGIGQETEKERRARHIERAAAWLLQADPDLRAIGRQQLLEFGRDAVPALEKAVAEKGLLEVLHTIRAIERPDGYVAARDLPPPEEELPKLDKGVADKYVQAKYAEAMAHVRKGNYQRGYDMANALVQLEARGAAAEKAKLLRRHCENMITQTTLLEAQVLQDRPACVAGDKLDLTLRMKNLYKSGMKISYADVEPAPADAGLAVLEIKVRVYDLYGASTEFHRTDEVRFEGEIPIATGAQWERRYLLDTAVEGHDDVSMIEITVSAWTHPLKIETDGRPVTRRIQFEPAVVKVLPRKCGLFLQNPLDWLQKTIERGVAQETFLCSQLLEGKEKELGTELLIQAMQKTDNPKYRESVSWMLVQLTGEKLGSDPKKWQDWLGSRGKKTSK